MDTLHISAVFLIAYFATIMLASAVTPPGLYTQQDIKKRREGSDTTHDIERRLEVLRIHRTRWIMERASSVLALLLMAVAFSLLAAALQTTGRNLISVLGAAAIIAGSIVGLYFVYRQTKDPRGGYSGAYPTSENLAYWLWLAGTLVFGVAILQAGLPAWLGYLTAGAALVYGVVFLLTRFGFMTPWLVGFLSLVIGIVLLGQ